MKVAIEITEADIRKAVFDRLRAKWPAEVCALFGCNQIEVKMTYNGREGWRRPKYLRLMVEKEINLE